MAHMFIFGLGYTATRIRDRLQALGWQVSGTGSQGTVDFDDDDAVRAALARASHVLSSVPPVTGQPSPADDALHLKLDPVLSRYGAALQSFNHGWLGYLSSTGVYGDVKGAWVDETSPIGLGRRNARAQCDQMWLDRGARVFRLPGIYGPARSAFDRLESGAARRIDVPQQVFSRVHVDDIATGVIAALAAPSGAYNLADDYPASQNAVIEEACRLVNQTPPPLVSLEAANLSPQALAFYSENRRVANGKAKRVLGWSPRYPSFREGLATINRAARLHKT